MARKINIGAGQGWYADGWEVLDNGSGRYDPEWKHRGKCWETRLPDDTYDLLFCSHMLEHVPHFRAEKTIAEFNRIMKVGGTIRILVPSLRKAAEAYVNNDLSYFDTSKHYTDHLGIGGSFLRVLISPGQQTVAISREFDEILGGYAHLYSYDFQMMKTMLEKWGFGDVVESEPGESALEELHSHQHLVCEGKTYDMSDPFVKNGEYLKSGKDWHFSGFDKTSKKQLVVEARKVRNESYALKKEYPYNRVARLDGPLDQIKIRLFHWICGGVDFADACAKLLRMNYLLRAFSR